MKNKIIEALQNKYKQLGLSAKAIEGAATFLEPSIKEESDIETAIAGVEPLLKALQSDADAVRTAKTAAEKKVAELEAQVKALGAVPDPKPQPKQDGDDIAAKIAEEVAKAMTPVKGELDAYKAKEAASARTNAITAKAKELGIPAWRIEEGFNIAEDADEAAIGTTLAKVAQNVKTAGLDGGSRFPLNSDTTPTPEEIAEIVSKMP